MTGLPETKLKQRGRASVDFICHLARGSASVHAASDADIAARVPDPAALPDDMDERHEKMVGLMSTSRAWRVGQLVSEWHARMHGVVAREAFEALQDDLVPLADRLGHNGPATLTLAPEGTISPDYWDGVNFHRTSGGWEGHPMQGYIHGEIVHRRQVEALYPGGIFRQRRDVAGRAPRDHYDRILDMGASTGHFTTALQETYPDAEIWGVDLSARALEHARRVANANGWAWKLFQRPAEDTGFPDASFDLVGSYILLHEIPADTIRALFREAFRVLRPGGDMIMSDVTRYADMDKVGQWKADAGALWGGEPYWRESASLDLGQVAREAGFVDVKAAGDPPRSYPFVVSGRKPL